MIDWGSVPDWMSGVGALVAVPALVFAYRSYRMQRRQVEDLLEDKKREHASKISVWVERSDNDGPLEYVVANRSDSPVYMVVV